MFLTSQEYTQEGGTRCPHCGSLEIEGHEVNIDAGHARQEMSCNRCGQGWQDFYTLAGYTANK